MKGQSFVDFTVSFVSTSVMFKHFTGGLVTIVTVRYVRLSLSRVWVFFLSTELLSGPFVHTQSPGWRMSFAPGERWVRKGLLSPTLAVRNVLGKDITMGQDYTDTYLHIRELTSFSHYLSATQKLKQTAWFFFLTHSCAWCWLGLGAF